jgi:hypothetical protein
MRRPLDWLVVIISGMFLYFGLSFPDQAGRDGLGESEFAPLNEFGEQELYVVRAIGDSAFAVKIERVEPLQVIDLSAPARHDEEHLLGLERDAAHLALDRHPLTSVNPR